MAYVHCMPARVLTLVHALDNVVSGTIETTRGEIAFRTRGHVVKATNRIYRKCSWKPTAGARVLLDGDLGQESLLVDHVECDRVGEIERVAATPHLEAVTAMIAGGTVPQKILRVWSDAQGSARVRYAKPASRLDGRGRLHDEIVHAALTDGEWRLWSVSMEGGAIAARGLDAALMIVVARAAGSDLLVGETEREREERVEREERAARVEAAARPAEPPPFDDCPF